ncbi:unnamed protein product, partial [Urochloa humidicola]
RKRPIQPNPILSALSQAAAAVAYALHPASPPASATAVASHISLVATLPPSRSSLPPSCSLLQPGSRTWRISSAAPALANKWEADGSAIGSKLAVEEAQQVIHAFLEVVLVL